MEVCYLPWEFYFHLEVHVCVARRHTCGVCLKVSRHVLLIPSAVYMMVVSVQRSLMSESH